MNFIIPALQSADTFPQAVACAPRRCGGGKVSAGWGLLPLSWCGSPFRFRWLCLGVRVALFCRAVGSHGAVFTPGGEFQMYFKMEESQCDSFSAGFLMPRFLIDKTIGMFHSGSKLPIYGTCVLKSREKKAVKRMADSLGVSFSALFYRLRHFNLFETHDMNEFCEELGFGGDYQ